MIVYKLSRIRKYTLKSKEATNLTKKLKTLNSVCTVHAPNEKDATTSHCLDRKEVPCATWRVHSTGTGRPVETQDVFF